MPLLEGCCRDDIRNTDEAYKMPSLCFASELEMNEGVLVVKGVNRLVLLEINNVEDLDESEKLKFAAAEMPQTLLAFVGADGHSVKIVAHYIIDDDSSNGDMLKFSRDEIVKQQTEAYKMMSLAYKAQMGVAVDNIEPTLERSCLVSYDGHPVYNEDAIDFVVPSERKADAVRHQLKTLHHENEEGDDEGLLPGRTKEQTHRMVFEACLQKAFDKCLGKKEGDFADEALHLVAKYCYESELPMEMAIKHTCYNSEIGQDEDYVRRVFANVYRKKLIGTAPLKHFGDTALLTYRTWALLTSRYELRRNVVTGQVQFRRRDGFNYSFMPLTERRRNSMTIEALKMGLNSWDKDLKRFIESENIDAYDPLEEYLDSLPSWDGTDRITEMAKRVKTNSPDWARNFHTWMLSMVAQWRGRNSEHGNAIIPLLVGFQGSGKSTFCSRILPPELMEYYNDKLNFDNDNAVQMALSRFALINLDEFDSLKKSQQPMLKYLAQKSDVKVRTLYTQNIESHRRYASFIGTTNNSQPLVDDTGSRRFICTLVTGLIDNTTQINHRQLYAQALYELSNGARFWFNEKENEVIQLNNEPFCMLSSVASMMESTFVKPVSDTEFESLGLDEIIARLKTKYPGLKVDGYLNIKIGHYLSQQQFESQHTRSGTKYKVVSCDRL